MRTPRGLSAHQSPTSVEDNEDQSNENSERPTRRRGHTKMKKVWNIKEGKQKDLELNDFNQFIGQDATTFANYLGTLARNGEELPLTYKDWRKVPETIKERLWDLVKLKWNVGPAHKDQTMKSFGKKLRDFKARLKKKHYDVHNTYQERLLDKDRRVLPLQWKFLIEMWDSEEWQEKSERNKASRKMLKNTHTSGTKSFARVAEEAYDRYKRSPTRAEVYVITHTDKKGQPMNDEYADVLRKMAAISRDQPEILNRGIREGDLYGEVFGKEKNGHVRGLGLGPSPKEIWGERLSRGECLKMVREAQEAQRRAEEAQSKMQADRKEEVVDRRRMAKQIANMQEQLAKLSKQQHVDGQQYLSNEHEQQNLNVDEDAHSSSSNHWPDSYANLNQRRIYNWDPHTSLNQNRNTNEDLPRNRIQKSTLNKVSRQEMPRINQELDEMQMVYLHSPMRTNPKVAVGYVMSKDPTLIVGGEELGNSFYEVYVDKVLIKTERLIRAYGNLKVIGDTKGKHIAWPKQLVRIK